MGNCGSQRNKTPGAFDDDDKKLHKKVKEYNEKAMKYLVEKTLGTVPNDEYGFDRDGRKKDKKESKPCLLYTSPSPRDRQKSRMPACA